MCQAKPGHDLPHYGVADTDVVGRLQPGAQVTQCGVRYGRHALLQGLAERLEPKRHVVVLRAGCRLTQVAQPRACFGHIRSADAKPLRQNRKRRVRMGQNPVTQILIQSLPASPRHHQLRNLPESFESQIDPVSEGGITIPVSAILV